MSLLTLEGIVENGQIRLRESVVLPERATVYVVVPDIATSLRPIPSPSHTFSPRLARPEQAADFAKQVIEASIDG